MNNVPKITVFMPVYNGEKYIRFAIGSILNQSYGNFELLIIDDCSTDKTAIEVRKFHDQRIRYIRNLKKLGLSRIRQKGIDEARGEIIAFLDSDDISLPNRLEIQLNFLQTNPQIKVVGSWVELINENGKRSGKIWKHAVSPKIIPSILLFRSCFSQSAVMLRKDCMKSIGYRQEYWAAPDFDLWARLSLYFGMANIPEVLIYYRGHEKNMTSENAHEIEKCTSNIFIENVRNLLFNTSMNDIIIHRLLEPGKLVYSEDEIEKIDKWLLMLKEKNKSAELYDNKIFSRLISDYWFKICVLSADKGVWILKKYFKSKLYIQSNKNFIKNVILFIFCLARKSKNIDITSYSWMRLIPYE